MLARLFVIVGGLVVLVLTAALVAPYFIDWTSYRSSFEREAGRVLGRDVQVQGTARARLLPFPSVTFTDVVVAGADPGQPAMTVDEFSMDAELAPFLSGELLIFDMRLVRPSMQIEIGPSGRIDWAVRPSSPFDPRQVTLEKMTISDGAITIHQQASGRTITLDDIDTDISARSLAGPWRVAGSLDIDGIPIDLTAATGAVADGAMRVRISARPRDYPLVIETDGSARLEDEEGIYTGTFRFAAVEPTADGEAEPAAAKPENPGNRVAGHFTLNHERLAIDEFRFETGPERDPYRADGSAVIELGADPSFSITADGAQIRLDDEADGGAISGLSADKRLAALTAFITELPKPSIPGTIAVNLPAIIVGDTTIRDIHVEAQPAEEGWNVASIAATLPGRTRFEGGGMLATGDALSFDGKILLAVSQPSGFAAWLARDVDEAIRRLPAAGFSADVALSEERQRFDNLELVLGDARFRGAIDRRSPAGARPSLMLSLNGDRLDLDGMRAFASLFVNDAGRNRFAGHDVDLDVTAGPVSAEGLTAEGLDTAMRLREGTLEIDRLTVTGLADANVSATGTISDIGGEPSGSLDASVVAVDLAPLVHLLAERFPDVAPLTALDRNAAAYPGLLADSAFDVVASSQGGLSASLGGTAGGTALNLSISGEGSFADLAEARLNTTFSAHNEDASALYALFGLPALPLGLTGTADAELSAEGSLAQGMNTHFRFFGEGLASTFDGQLVRAGETFTLKGNAWLESDDLEPWLATAGISLPGFGYGLPARLSAAVDAGGGPVVVSNLEGTVAGSDVRGDLNAELRDGLPHFTGSLALSGLDPALAAEMVAGSEAFEAAEAGAWPRAPFRESAAAPFSADVELSADRLWLGNAATVEDARLRLKLDARGLAISELAGRIYGGTVEGLAEFRNDDGTGLFSAQLSLRDAPLQSLLPESGLSGRSDVSAGVTASGKSMNAMVAALAGSGSASVQGLEIAGISPSAITPIIAAADEFGVDIDAQKVASFAPGLVRDGRFHAGDVDFAFTVANGVARMPPVQLESRAARMSVEAAADLEDRTVSATGGITYDAGREAVTGSEPVVRFAYRGGLGREALTLDTDPLAQFLTQRALEREQARVEHMQALLLERQRLRRETNYFEAKAQERAAAEAERVRLEAEAERQRQAEEERRRQEAEARRQAAEEAARQAAEEAARRRAEEEALGQEAGRPPEETAPSDVRPGETAPAESPADRPAAEEEGAGSPIERRSLPPPPAQGMEPATPTAPRTQGDLPDPPGLDLQPVLQPHELTVERLLEMLDRSEQ
ncbi:AsmA family protein [Chelativorans sp. AA-79]|uniref:AsmA family protein n=1 Tax=Chelativorans sp. AA-79 TaxID=3028735 RepID=UPI0023F95B2A|nr:AsmA family protein [Chelativorans sp. AA-79]WEX11372.1 AsmA family protein [Chelativorans sp. AA-79]